MKKKVIKRKVKREVKKVPKTKSYRVYTKTRIHDAMYQIICPFCKTILSSASEIEYLPLYSTCKNCKEKGW